jgi:hypothetical protein
LANELRLRANSLIQLEKASVVRLVIKKRNVPLSDASNQVNEEDFRPKNYSTTKINNQRFDFLELENSTNQPLQNEIQTVQSNLRKVQLTNKEEISTSTHNHHQEKTNGYTLPSTVVAISTSQSDIPEWRRALNERRRNAANDTS